MTPVEISQPAQFNAAANGFVLFWAEWCGPCKMLKPRLETLFESKGIAWHTFNAGAFLEFAKSKGIRNVPTLVKYQHGAEAGRIEGNLLPQAIDAFVEQYR